VNALLALSLSNSVTEVGALAAFAALLGIAILSLLVFSQAREIKRLREWAGRAPERAAEMEQRVSADAAARVRGGVPPGPPGQVAPVRVVPRKTPLVSAPVSTAVNATVAAVVPAQAGPQTPNLPAPAPASEPTPAATPAASGAVPSVSPGVPVESPLSSAGADAKVGPDLGAPGQSASVGAETSADRAQPLGSGAEPLVKPTSAAQTQGGQPDAAGQPFVAGQPDGSEQPSGAPATAAARAAGASARAAGAPARAPLPPSPTAPAPPGTAPSSAALTAAGAAAAASRPASRPPAPLAAARGVPSRAVGSAASGPSPRSSSPPARAGTAATSAGALAGARPPGGPAGTGPKYFKPERSPRRAMALIVAGVVVGVLVLVLAVSALKGGGSTPTTAHSQSPSSEVPVTSSHKTSSGVASRPAETAVVVLNGTSTPELAHHLAADLQQSGYTLASASTGVPPGSHATTEVQYVHGHHAEARAVAKALNVTHVQPIESTIAQLVGPATVVVLAGADQASQLGGAQSSGEPAGGAGAEGAPAGQ
jgi:hypothetical protein